MPIYEYACTHCQHTFERIQKIQEASITQCPQCEKQTVQKQISAAGFQLKGNGWYVTDFKKGGKSGTSENTSESKSAPKTTD